MCDGFLAELGNLSFHLSGKLNYLVHRMDGKYTATLPVIGTFTGTREEIIRQAVEAAKKANPSISNKDTAAP